jgi:hypothetical protein
MEEDLMIFDIVSHSDLCEYAGKIACECRACELRERVLLNIAKFHFAPKRDLKITSAVDLGSAILVSWVIYSSRLANDSLCINQSVV